jgi:hypothetical protein
MARTKKPIMTPEEEQFMAFQGLLQWTQAVITQSQRVSEAKERQSADIRSGNSTARQQAILNFHSQCHFFVIAAHKVIEYRKWASTFGLCATVDFSEIDAFSEQDIRDLRNMGEHVVDYFQGHGVASQRWFAETPYFKADASSIIGTMIGGRLDWIKFAAAAERLLPKITCGANPICAYAQPAPNSIAIFTIDDRQNCDRRPGVHLRWPVMAWAASPGRPPARLRD